MKMPEWMRRFADICTEGHLALLASRTSTRVRTVESRLPCPECGLSMRLALTRDLGRCIYCRRVFTGAELMELGRRGSYAR